MQGIEHLLNKKFLQMKEWLEWKMRQSLFYFSTDIRNSGFKVATIDANFFPAGFGLFSECAKKRAAKKIEKKIKGKKVLLLIEDHTRNQFYFKNVHAIGSILTMAGNEVRFANLSNLTVSQSCNLHLEKISRKEDKLLTSSGFIPDVVVINNDMISSKPEVLDDILQECIPPTGIGWFNRKKSDYFCHYDQVVKDFCDEFEIDSWFFSAYWNRCDNVDFKRKIGTESIYNAAEDLIAKISKKYQEYQIKDTPYVFIKANRGSYGMGVVPIFDPQQIVDPNKSLRKKMESTKGNTLIQDVLIQEGVKTVDKHLGHPSELMCYTMYGEVVAFIDRYNTLHNSQENLNSSGMQFADSVHHAGENKVLFLVSALSVIAAEREILQVL